MELCTPLFNHTIYKILFTVFAGQDGESQGLHRTEDLVFIISNIIAITINVHYEIIKVLFMLQLQNKTSTFLSPGML